MGHDLDFCRLAGGDHSFSLISAESGFSRVNYFIQANEAGTIIPRGVARGEDHGVAVGGVLQAEGQGGFPVGGADDGRESDIAVFLA